jgi:CRISPR-associated protein Cst2
MYKGLTFTAVFQAGSLNYGEGIGNISELKKLNRGNGNTYTFASRQCLDYDIVRLGSELFDWKLDTVCNNGTIQYKKESTIKDSEEMDLFGYMKTTSNSAATTRSAAVRVSHAISLEPYKSDMDFLNNKGLADRIKENPNLANIEQHQSFYAYTVTIDLRRIGVDGEIKIDHEERLKRVNQLLTIIKVLNRNIRGRQENLSPLFIIGGLYDIPNPFFQGRVVLETNGEKFNINVKPLKNTIETTLFDKSIGEFTFAGIVDGIFGNREELDQVLPNKSKSVEEFFKIMQDKLKEVYK